MIVLAIRPSHASESWSKDFDQAPVSGPYSKALDQLVTTFVPTTWESVPKELRQNGNLELQCFFDPEQKSAVGVIQYMEIAAPKDVVQKTMDNIDGYQGLFPGYKKISILEKRNEKWLTYWEQSIPFPFSNIRYRMLYTVTSKGGQREVASVDDLKMYRYQLSWSDDIRYSDGLIALTSRPDDPKKTKYFEIDFWDVKLGLGGAIAPSRIRRESIEGVYLSDRGIQIKAEHPEMTDSEVQKLAKKTMDHQVIERCLASKDKFQPFWSANSN